MKYTCNTVGCAKRAVLYEVTLPEYADGEVPVFEPVTCSLCGMFCVTNLEEAPEPEPEPPSEMEALAERARELLTTMMEIQETARENGEDLNSFWVDETAQAAITKYQEGVTAALTRQHHG